MPELIRDYLTLPDRAMLDRFIVKDGSDPSELARTYVFTRGVTEQLDHLLTPIGLLLTQRQDWQSLGRWVFGSFGSGKSHFLRIVEMLLSRDQRLYTQNTDPALLELQGKHSFLVKAKILTVRVTMMSAGASDGLTIALARAFDDRLSELGLEPAHVFDHEKLFTAFDQYCSRGSTILDEFLDANDYDRASFAAIRAGDFAQRRTLARECAAFMYGNDDTRFEPNPADARSQMARHAAGLGFQAIAFLIDEFVLWAQSLPGEEYIGAANELTGLVDAERQPIPFIVLPAIQRSISERFQDDHSEDALRNSLSHTIARFSPMIVLEDKDIFEVAQRRVLAVRPARREAWHDAVSKIVDKFEAQQAVLVGNDAPETLKQLYPFHPALLHVLSDVSQGLQRERTSLFMLFQLLVEIRPNLELGQLVSLGALWEAIYSKDNVAILKQQVSQRGTNDAAHELVKTLETWDRLREPIQNAAKTDDAIRVLDLLVKSILLCQLSRTRFFGDERPLSESITIENLFRLNRAEVDVPIEALGSRTVSDLLSRLAGVAPSIVKVEGKTPRDRVSIALDTVDIAAMVDGLKPTAGDRFSILAKYVKAVLDLSSDLRDDNLDGVYPVTWRATNRKGRVRLERLDLLAGRSHDNDFAPGESEAFRILVLLNVADPQAAVERVAAARAYAQQWTGVLVPGALSARGAEALEVLAKLELVYAREKNAALGGFKMSMHPIVDRQVAANRSVAEEQLREALTAAYARDAQLLTLRNNAPELFVGTLRDPGRIVQQTALQLLDLRYPQHPKFPETPRKPSLEMLFRVVQRANQDGGRTALDSTESLIVERLGVPLELFDHGQLVASLRATGLYTSAVRLKVDEGESTVAGLRKSLLLSYGIEADVADAIIAAFATQADYRLSDGGTSRVISTLSVIGSGGWLVNGDLPDQATWIGGRSNALALFGELRDVALSLSPTNVEALVTAFHGRLAVAIEAMSKVRDTLTTLQRKGLFSGSSVSLEAYRGAATQLAAFPKNERLVKELARLDEATIKRLRNAIDAAGDDDRACQSLLHDKLIDMVKPELRSELQRTLEQVGPPIAGALGAWGTKATEWIRTELEKKRVPEEPPRPPHPPESGLPGTKRFKAGTVTELNTALAELQTFSELQIAGGASVFLVASVDPDPTRGAT